jgi:chromosomal replication initiator protein
MSLHAASELWVKVCEQLQRTLHPDIYSRWIAVIEAADLGENSLTLSVDNDFYQSWLEENYLPVIETTLAAVAGVSLRIDFVIRPRTQAEEEQPQVQAAPAQAMSRSAPLETKLNPRYTFDEFIVGSSNTFPHASALAVAQAPARAYNPLFIYGGVGLGKTHLMEAIGNHILASSRARVCYISSEAFLNEYIDALQTRSIMQFRKKYRSVDLLLIDDIHFLASKERLQEEFFHTFNTLYDARKQIVMTSDRPASEIAGLEQRLVSRFEWGLVTELESPDLETRIAILRHKQAQAKVSIPDDILFFIAQNIRSNIRRLEGALVRTVSYASLTKRPLSIDTVKNLLRDTLEQEKHSEVTFATIQKAVAAQYDIRLSDMSSTDRHRSVAVPRQVAMYLCRRMTNFSYPDIAAAFNKTHATVLHAFRLIENRVKTDPELGKRLELICEKLQHSKAV